MLFFSDADIARASRREPAKAALMRACRQLGSPARLAKAVGRDRQAVYKWLEVGQVSEQSVEDVARLSGIPKHELRPDLFKAPRNGARP